MFECFSALSSTPTPQHRAICQPFPCSAPMRRLRNGANTNSVGVQLLLLLCQSYLPPHPFLLIQLLGHPAPSSRSRVSPPHPTLYALATVISLERCPCRHQHQAFPGLWTLWGFGGSGTPRTDCLLSPDRGWSNAPLGGNSTDSVGLHTPGATCSQPHSAFLQAIQSVCRQRLLHSLSQR